MDDILKGMLAELMKIRLKRFLTWKKLAKEIGISNMTLTPMRKGNKVGNDFTRERIRRYIEAQKQGE